VKKHILPLLFSLVAMQALTSDNFFCRKHQNYTGHFAIEKFKNKYPQIYAQNTTKNTQQSIAQLNSLVCNGEDVNLLLTNLPKEEGIKEDIMNAVVPVPKVFLHQSNPLYSECKFPVTIARLTICLAEKAMQLQDNYLNEDKLPLITSTALGTSSIFGSVSVLLGQDNFVNGQVALAGAVLGGLGALAGVKTKERNLTKKVQQYFNNVQAFAQHGAYFFDNHIPKEMPGGLPQNIYSTYKVHFATQIVDKENKPIKLAGVTTIFSNKDSIIPVAQLENDCHLYAFKASDGNLDEAELHRIAANQCFDTSIDQIHTDDITYKSIKDCIKYNHNSLPTKLMVRASIKQDFRV